MLVEYERIREVNRFESWKQNTRDRSEQRSGSTSLNILFPMQRCTIIKAPRDPPCYQHTHLPMQWEYELSHQAKVRPTIDTTKRQQSPSQ